MGFGTAPRHSGWGKRLFAVMECYTVISRKTSFDNGHRVSCNAAVLQQNVGVAAHSTQLHHITPRKKSYPILSLIFLAA
jgi:hypothetical protein